jgi:hypothetical protein
MVSTTHVCISLIYVLIKTKLSSMGKKCSLLIFKQIIRPIFKQIIRPILTYACPVWGNCASSHIKKNANCPKQSPQNNCKCSVVCQKSKSAIDTLNKLSVDFFPNIWCLISILVTLPVSTASSERSFSILKRLKSCLRNSTSENRLTGLSHVNSSKYFNKH